jgi:hypothetical protein
MQSIWDYIRLRTRDSMLAGMQEALEAVGLDETAEHDQAAARRLLERAAVLPQIPAANSADANGSPEAASPIAKKDTRPAAAAQIQHIGRTAEKMRSDTQPLDAFERRLQQTNPALAPAQPDHAPRKRGRPRKNP